MNKSPIIFKSSPVTMYFTVLSMVLCLGLFNSVRAGEKTSSRQRNVKSVDAAYKPNEVLVLMSAETGTKGVQAAETLKSVERLSAGKARKQIRLSKNKQIVSLTLPAGKSVKQALAENWSKKDPRILLVEPNWRVRKMTTPDDTLYPNMWGLNNTGQNGGMVDADIDAPEAWGITTGSSDIVVGIVDSGIDYLHPDLAANVWTNVLEAAGTAGVDDDGNGYVDDIHGYDFVMDDGDPMDADGHGTHVAGTIAAVGNNSLGVVGVNWQCKVMACRFLDASGSGWTDDAINAINYAVANGARILNNSWGGGGYSSLLEDTIANARDNGVLFVAAAGNESSNNDTTPSYPASYDVSNVIAVAATDRYDNLSSFSNYGATSVHLGAPGESILSSVPPFLTLFEETFQGATGGGFTGTQLTATGTWITLPCSFDSSNIVAMTDSTTYPYSAGSDSYLTTPAMDTRGLRGLSAQVLIRGEVDPSDILQVEVWDGSTWYVLGELASWTYGVYEWYDLVACDIPDAYRNEAMQIRLHWITDSDNNDGYGVEIDDIRVQYIGSDYSDAYADYSGTSMAAPHVTGAAALLLANNPAMSLSELKSRLLLGGDAIPSLNGITTTGKRLNVSNSLTLSDQIAISSPNGGESWGRGSIYTIQWASIGGGSTVSIYLVNDAGTLYTPIAEDISNTGSCSWFIPADTPLGTDYRIWIDDGLTSDESNGTFEIRDTMDYFTELFESGSSFDMDYRSLVLTPTGSTYAACLWSITSLPTDPTGGTTLSLSDDSYTEVILSGASVPFYGTSYSSFYVGSNGYITFGSSSTTYNESFDNHFSLKRISALFDDLNPGSSGTVSEKQMTDRIAVTWQNVPEYNTSNTNTFQIEMFFDGKIVISWLDIAAIDGLAGISNGPGATPTDFVESNLSGYGSCAGCMIFPVGDLNSDCKVNLEDLSLMATNWLLDCEASPEEPACN